MASFNKDNVSVIINNLQFMSKSDPIMHQKSALQYSNRKFITFKLQFLFFQYWKTQECEHFLILK